MMTRAPENKDAADRRSAKEGEEIPAEAYGPDGVFHVMEAELIASALSKDAPENQAPLKPSVIHVMELQMKGEAVSDWVETQPGIDNTLPEEPLPGKPPEPPLGGEGRSASDRNPKPTQLPAEPDRNGNGRRGRR